MPEPVRIPVAAAELTARFASPCLPILAGRRPEVFETLVKALQPFGFQLANAEIIASPKPSEDRLIFRLPERGISIQVGAEECKLTKEAASWLSAEDDVKIWCAVESSLSSAVSPVIGSRTATVAMHVVPSSRSRDELLRPFLPLPLTRLFDSRCIAHAAHVRFEDGCELLFDYSLAYANGLFIRLTMVFGAEVPTGQLLTDLRGQQLRLFDSLGIAEQQA
jgi:hypothetical protein